MLVTFSSGFQDKSELRLIFDVEFNGLWFHYLRQWILCLFYCFFFLEQVNSNPDARHTCFSRRTEETYSLQLTVSCMFVFLALFLLVWNFVNPMPVCITRYLWDGSKRHWVKNVNMVSCITFEISWRILIPFIKYY